MSARELRAEARAWRRAAEQVHDYVCLANGLRVEMTVRFRAHFKLLDYPGFEADDNARVLACLFLALECEDEAKEATRG